MSKAHDKTQSTDTKLAHQVLLEGLNRIEEAMENTSIARKVEVGSVLWELGDRVREILENIKSDVREAAIMELKGQVGSTTFDGDDVGSATVTIPSASLKISKGKDIESIKKALGSRFSFFFEEVITYKPQKEFEARVEKISDPLEQKVLLEAVERHELTPRVSFRRESL